MTTRSSYEIQGRSIDFPVEVRDSSSGAASFLVPTSAASRLIPEAFEIAEILPGRGLCNLAMVDYRDNDLGDYNEIAVGFMVVPRGAGPSLPFLGPIIELLRGRLASHLIHMPVDQSFTCEAGATIWGYPKTVERIDIEMQDDRATARLEVAGQHALTLSVTRGGDRRLPESQLETLSLIEGVPHRTLATQQIDGMGFHLGSRGVEIELGEGRLADDLRSLGFPRAALFSVWMEHMRAAFGRPEKL